ncbi:LrgB family protein [Novosphingobium umbonatum]|uniref:LrgB family protein n=1 Tax=Novosphingobium umbonatum TaxID=1908524 RepID=A0A3S2UQB5_9SPHN|nr:LrgB family protein [Novosphingobium umbonatum]RVU03445.1 LrgB family protein [Novosphingobium umbonatum]
MSALFSLPLFWIAVTVLVFEGAERISRATKRHPLAQPLMIAVPVLMLALHVTHTSYASYIQATDFIVFLLGPAVVGLAVPIWAQRKMIKRLALPLGLALAAGSLTAMISVGGLMWVMGAPHVLITSGLPRATTTAVAMALSEQLGGVPALTIVFVAISGMMGAMVALPMFNRMGLTDHRARGLAMGITAHGFGAARAYEDHPVAGAFASLGMALNAVVSALLAALLVLTGW